MSLTSTSWGTDPISAEALFSLLAFFAAAVAACYAKKIVRIERDRFKQESADRTSFQADRVACWVIPEVDELGDDPDIRDYAFASISAQIQNSSLHPIYDFSISYKYQGLEVHHSELPVIPPGDAFSEFIPQEVLNKVSTISNNFDIPMNIHEARRLAKYEASRFTVSFYFTDSNQIKWHRDSSGRLEKITN